MRERFKQGVLKIKSKIYPKAIIINSWNSVIKNWRTYTYSLRVKTHQQDMGDLLLTHKEKDSPQAIQGMWQAYGQMRAGRTTARGATLATGIIGVGLWLYQQSLSQQKKKLVQTKQALKEREEDFAERDKLVTEMFEEATETFESYKKIESMLQVADQTIRKMCKEHKGEESESCYQAYESAKEKAIKEISKKQQNDQNTLNSSDLSENKLENSKKIRSNI